MGKPPANIPHLGTGFLCLILIRLIDDPMTTAQRQSRFAVILAFGLVYFFWGSTYLAIDIAVERIPPALMCGIRFLIAGVFMLAFCGLRGRNIWYNPRQLGQMAIVGVLLLMGGNLTLSYAEKYVASGLAALIVAVTPLWFLVLDTLLLGDHHVSPRGKIGLGLGVAGLAVLLWPDLTTTTSFGRVQLWASISLLGGSFSWALGSVLAKRWKSADVDPFSATAWQMIAAGLANLLLAFAAGDLSRVVWTSRGIGATLYLVVCGSWIGYTAYIWLLNHVPTAKVSTYAYVNPVVAVFLGWLVLHERVDRYILAGSAIVVASVILVTSAQVTKKADVGEMAMVETTGD
jgi:drug/metabolite transporter (DMT)-like permease